MSAPFVSTGPALLAAGYSPIPVMPGDKMPGRFGAGGWELLTNWSRYCSTPAHPTLVEKWTRWPNAGVGVALGRGLVGIDIDNDEPAVREAIESVLPPCTVGKVGSRGVTYFFRGDTTKIKSRAFKIDGQGIVDVLAHGRQTVLPPSIHPKTGQPYRWLTGMQALEDVRLEDLNEIPDDINDRIGLALVPFGYVIESAQRHHGEYTSEIITESSDGTWFRQLNSDALLNLDAWVPLLQLPKTRKLQGRWVAVADWRPSSSGRPVAQRKPNLSFHKNGICDHGDGGKPYTAINVVMAARGMGQADLNLATKWLGERLGYDFSVRIVLKTDAQKAAERAAKAAATQPLAPTYADERIPVEGGRRAIAVAFTDFVSDPVQKFRKAQEAYELARYDDASTAVAPKPEGHLVKGEAGLGKSTALVPLFAQVARDCRATGRSERPVYATPRHELNAQVRDDFAAELEGAGLTVLAYRGKDQPDPDAPGFTMCRDLPAYTDAEAAGVSAYNFVCRRKDVAGNEIRCQHYDACGMIRQREAQADLNVVPHANLFLPRPSCIQPAAAIAIDENPLASALSAKPVVLTLDEIRECLRSAHTPHGSLSSHLDAFAVGRAHILRLLEQHPVGYLTRQSVTDSGLEAEDAERFAEHIEALRVQPEIWPGMDPRARRETARRAGAVNRIVSGLVELYREIAEFLHDAYPESGRIRVEMSPETGAKVVRVRRLRRLHPTWEAATLVTSATPSDEGVMSKILGMRITKTADVSVEWPASVTKRQFLGMRTSHNGFELGTKGRARKGGKPALKFTYFARFINTRALPFAGQQDILVVCTKKVRAVLEEQFEFLSNVAFEHFGGLTGLNKYKDVAGIILIGRELPGLEALEADADILAGYPVQRVDNWTLSRGGIAMADGRVVEVSWQTHPDPYAEEIRRQSVEYECLQALARIRPLLRSADKPAFVDIFNDVPLPLVIDELGERDEVERIAWADMIPLGIIYTAEGDIAAALGVSGKQAERILADARKSGFVALSAKDKLIAKRATNSVVQYQQAGAGKKPQIAYILPNGPQTRGAIKRRIQSDLAATGEIAWFSFDPLPGSNMLPVDVTLARIGRKEGTIVSRLSEIGA